MSKIQYIAALMKSTERFILVLRHSASPIGNFVIRIEYLAHSQSFIRTAIFVQKCMAKNVIYM